ncbi:hypothetical protein [Nocardia sp. NPDC024068]|uniref:DUF6782 family putative metallopeptidase n=1 Tax=Nocardia sp. NPDC024068 TaxID=3157197 RepID=UPI0033C0D99F
MVKSAAVQTSAKYRGIAHGMRGTEALQELDRRPGFTTWEVVGLGVSMMVAAKTGSAIFHAVHDDPAEPESPVTSEIDPTVERYAAMSPFLRQQLANLRAEGWTIGYGAIDSLGATRNWTKTIVIDESLKSDPLKATSVLAHEVGHAYPGQFDPGPLPPHPDEDYTSWLERNLRLRRLSEAESELVAGQVRWEIMREGGPDIGLVDDIAMHLYMAADTDLMSRDEARERMTEHLDWYSFANYWSEHERVWNKFFAETHGPAVERPDRAGSPAPPKSP